MNVGVVKPLGSATLAAGIAEPHCEEAVAVGAVGNGLTFTSVEAETGHPFTVAFAVYVVAAVGFTTNGLPAPTVVTPSDHE